MDPPPPIVRPPFSLLESATERLRNLFINFDVYSREEIFECLRRTQSEIIELMEFYTNEPMTNIRRF